MKKLSEPLVRRGCATMYAGDMRVVVPALGKFTACVTDPPYEIGFMGKTWDSSGIAFDAKTWRVVLDALKPGGLLLAFGGTRTFHRIAVAIEDAGFEIRDCIMWLYGSGFPKSLDVSLAIDKAAGAKRKVIGSKIGLPGFSLAPSTGRNIYGGSFGGTGDPVREAQITAPATDAAKQWSGYGTALKPAFEPIIVAMKPLDGTFAANAQQHGVAGMNIDTCRVAAPGGSPAAARREIAVRTGHMPGRPGEYGDGHAIVSRSTPERYTTPRCGEQLGRWPANLLLDEDAAQQLGDTARFFYTAKTSVAERQAGLERCEQNLHPTLKPIDLMRYLVKLVTMPTGTRILDPFAGSGSTLVACRQLGVECVGVDLDPINCRIADGRLSYRVGVSKHRKLKLRGRRIRKES